MSTIGAFTIVLLCKYRVKPGQVHAQINLRNDLSIRNGSIGLIDASYSYDEDEDPTIGLVNSQLEYYWSCKVKHHTQSAPLTPVTQTKRDVQMDFYPCLFKMRITVLNPSNYRVASWFYGFPSSFDHATLRVDYASVVVEVMPPDFPSLHIPISTLLDLGYLQDYAWKLPV